MISIQENVLNKLDTKFSVKISEELYDISFFNPKVGLVARNFIDLVYEIEREFGIVFDEKALINPEFCTLNGFVRGIKERINS